MRTVETVAVIVITIALIAAMGSFLDYLLKARL